MTTANKITVIRVALIPCFVILMLLRADWARAAALAIFLLAGLSDLLDGYIARKYHQVSAFGIFMDPLADKLLVTAALLLLVELGQLPAWAAIVIVSREFAVTALRLVAASEGKVISAGRSGKLKTASSMVCLCLMLTPLHGVALLPGFTVDALGKWVMVLTTVYSGVDYFRRHGRILRLR